MSEKESKEILESLDKAIVKMSEFDKGYLLGMSEAMVSKRKNQETMKNEDTLPELK